MTGKVSKALIVHGRARRRRLVLFDNKFLLRSNMALSGALARLLPIPRVFEEAWRSQVTSRL